MARLWSSRARAYRGGWSSGSGGKGGGGGVSVALPSGSCRVVAEQRAWQRAGRRPPDWFHRPTDIRRPLSQRRLRLRLDAVWMQLDWRRHDTTRHDTGTDIQSPGNESGQDSATMEMGSRDAGFWERTKAGPNRRLSQEGQSRVCSVQCALCSVHRAACSTQCLGGEWVRVRKRMRTPVCGRVLQLDGSVG
jgi:hypothetical protein